MEPVIKIVMTSLVDKISTDKIKSMSEEQLTEIKLLLLAAIAKTDKILEHVQAIKTELGMVLL